jgi:hypothetical protein
MAGMAGQKNKGKDPGDMISFAPFFLKARSADWNKSTHCLQ